MSVPVEGRRLMVQARESGVSISHTAKVFHVGQATVKRIMRQWRDTGSLEPSTSPERAPILDDGACALMQAWLKKDNDLTLGELCVRLSESGYEVTPQAVFYRLKAIGWSFKKTMRATEKDREDVRELRAKWYKLISDIPPLYTTKI